MKSRILFAGRTVGACLASSPILAQTVTVTAPDDSATEAGVYPGLFRV